MAQLTTVRLSKAPGQSWGFRLQGGKDFATPLCIQKVNGGSVAANAGLQAGDNIVSINNQDALALRHKEAQDHIINAGNNFEIVIQRGGASVWRPQVAPLPEPVATPQGPVATKTSLAAAPRQPIRFLGSNHNCVPRPFRVSTAGIAGLQSSAEIKSSLPPPIVEHVESTRHTIDVPDNKMSNDMQSAAVHEQIPNKTRGNPVSNGIAGARRGSLNVLTSGTTNGYHDSGSNQSEKVSNGFGRRHSSFTSPPPPLFFNDDKPLTITGTDVELDKETARNFLQMTLERETEAVNNSINQQKSSGLVNQYGGTKFNNTKPPLIQGIPSHSRSSSSSSLSSGGGIPGLIRGTRKMSLEGGSTGSCEGSQDWEVDSNSSGQFNSKNTDVNGVPIMPTSYNSPINLYSDDNIAETLSAQAEVLGKGVLGVNFMKNDRSFDGKQSDVLRMVQEMDNEPPSASIEQDPSARTGIVHSDAHSGFSLHPHDRPVAQGTSFKMLQAAMVPNPSNTVYSPVSATPPKAPGFSSVQAPKPTAPSAGSEQLRPGENICPDCGRLIVGVFVRVKDKNLHAECFKCATCGCSLKNVGYYNINDKLYCDIHAKQAARVNPPGPNMVPVTVKPGAATPAGAISAAAARAQAALARPPPGGVKLFPTPSVPTFKPSPSFNAPAPAPAPSVVAPPKPAPAPVFTATKSSANPQNFGAPSGDVNIRSHIPKKGTDFGFPAPAPAPMPAMAPPSSMPKPGPIMGGTPGGPVRGVPMAPGHRTAPRRGRGIMNKSGGSRIPVCAGCQRQIRGPFVTALGKTWCPDHFICGRSDCRKPLIELGFVEEQGSLYCEDCYEKYLAPICGKCDRRVKGDCLNAVGKQFHPECFCCAYCGKIFGSGAFYLEDGLPYCEADWNELFTTKCVGCNFPIEAGDRWVEALNNNYHSQCFKCSKCNKNLEGQSFFAKGGKPFCKAHAQRGGF